MHIVQVGTLLKTIRVDDVDRKQTLLILPTAFLRQFTAAHCASFQELCQGALRLDISEQGERPQNRPYRFVTPKKGGTWVSVPRQWLRNMGARPGDFLDVFEDPADKRKLIVQYRRTVVGQG